MKFESNKSAPTPQKLRGGYYTPSALAEFMSSWAIRDGSERILEPSCGDGSFVREAASCLSDLGRIVAVEIDQVEIAKAKKRASAWGPQVTWIGADFFDVFAELSTTERFDVLLGNPPFIRFQHFDTEVRERAFGLLRTYGYRPTGLANAWASFVQLGAELIRDGGRLAMVLPAELLQVQYAAELRLRLPQLFDDVLIVGFDEIVFPEIQQEVVLLLCEGRNREASSQGRIHTMQLLNGRDLLQRFSSGLKVSHLPKKHADHSVKWTSLFLADQAYFAIQRAANSGLVKRLGAFASVDVGIVTGRNKFFVLDDLHAREICTQDQYLDVVGRTSALKSVSFSQADLKHYATSFPSKLLNLRGVKEKNFSSKLKQYLSEGEASGVNCGYKCRIRGRWFDVPSVYIPDALLFRQIHNAPLLVANHARVTSTDTIHRVRLKSGIKLDQLCGASVNSLTFAWAEICGRSYGGGVLELEPTEAEELPLPYEHAADVDLEYLDGALRAGQLDKALDHADEIILRRGMGLSRSDVAHIRGGWSALRDRRQRRKYVDREDEGLAA